MLGDIPPRPLFLKFGVALAISLGGILYTYFRAKKSQPPKPNPSRISPDISTLTSHGIRIAYHSLKDSSPTKVSSRNSFGNASPSSRHSVDRDGHLLPELNEVIKECKVAVTADNIFPGTNGESLSSGECDEQIRELKSLRNKVEVLEERERTMEIELLEYYGLKEQETAVMELQNQLRLNGMEAKLYSLKIESLGSENRRLEAQVADYAKVATELEGAKAKIKILRKKLRLDAEQNREQILILQERVMKLQDQEIDQGFETQLQKCKELEKGLEEMKELNTSLKMENSELAQKLEYVKMLGTAVLDSKEMLELKEEIGCLRQRNEDLTKEIDQLQADRCTDVEELVYLRWINACLRHELRNFKPIHANTLARDLSKTLSPKSEEKAKQLILDYANKDGLSDKGPNVMEFDSDRWSSSQASYFTDSVEPDDSSVDTLSVKKINTPRKMRVFSKLMRLLRGKDSGGNPQAPSSPLERVVSLDYTSPSRFSSDSHADISVTIDGRTDGAMMSFTTSSGASSRRSFDLQRSYSQSFKNLNRENSSSLQRSSHDSSLGIFRSINSITRDDANDSSSVNQPMRDPQTTENSELIKYAQARNNSRMKASLTRRSASYSSF